MRPLELTVRNFRSYYGDDVVFDFRGRRLIGIVGPIGSGKSSILDAIAFALYGKTPTIASATKSLIHQRADRSTVALRFEVEGEVWQVVRALRRTGQSHHSLSRLSGDTAEPEELEKLVLEADVNAKIVELLGLEFDAFSRSVLLAQGRFAEFLKSRPAERDKVLKGVFGHDRIDAMRAVAKARADTVAVELEKSAVRIEELESLRAKLAADTAQLADIEARRDVLAKAEPQFAALDERERAAMRERDEATGRLESMTAAAGKLPDERETLEMLEQVTLAGERRSALAGKIDTAQTSLAEAEAGLAKFLETGGVSAVPEAERLVAKHETVAANLDKLRSRVASLEERLDAATKTLGAAERRVEEAEEAAAAARRSLEEAQDAFEQAQNALHEAQHADMAAALRRELSAGDTCPVCEQPVTVVPDVPAGAIDAARAAAETAGARLEEAGRALQSAERSMADAREAAAKEAAVRDGLVSELEAAVDAERAMAAELADIGTKLTALLGEGDPAERIEGIRAEQARLEAAVAEARKTVERLRAEHDAAIVAEQDATRRLGELRMQLAEVAARLDTAPDIPDDPAALAPVVARLLAAWDEALEDLELRSRAASEELEKVAAERAGLAADLQLTGDFTTALAEAGARAKLLAAEIERAESRLAEAGELAAAHEELEKRRAGYEQIAGDLTNAKFIRFLLDDERSRLSRLGSEHFERLSSGRYRFTEDGKFDVVDLTAADAVRKADSLSGGETFVASLGLALALAEMVTRTGGRLDAFFIDEGFGSLDPEHLDLAMEGIEALAADGDERLVVVVSHVPEMRHRIEDLIELDRDPMTGDTRVVRA